MKRKLVWTVLTLAILLFAVAGCTSPGGSSAYEFVGTWQTSASGQTETVVFTTTSISVTDSGYITGTMSSSIQAVDTAAKHIKMSMSSATGIYTLYPIGTVFYMTYNVTGNTMYFSTSTSSYPSSATSGPYLKQ